MYTVKATCILNCLTFIHVNVLLQLNIIPFVCNVNVEGWIIYNKTWHAIDTLTSQNAYYFCCMWILSYIELEIIINFTLPPFKKKIGKFNPYIKIYIYYRTTHNGKLKRKSAKYIENYVKRGILKQGLLNNVQWNDCGNKAGSHICLIYCGVITRCFCRHLMIHDLVVCE